MKLLLDTHVWLWWNMQPERLRKRSRALIRDVSNQVFLSPASSWEIAIKTTIGKLELPVPLEQMVTESLNHDNMQSLPLHHRHCFELSELPLLHKDPFDRVLIAQARVEGLTLMTVDPMIPRYDVKTWKA